MNLPSIIILIIVIAILVWAFIVYRKKGNNCSCGENCSRCRSGECSFCKKDTEDAPTVKKDVNETKRS